MPASASSSRDILPWLPFEDDDVRKAGKHANFIVKAAQSGYDVAAVGEQPFEVQIFTASG